MTPDHAIELALIETSRIQRAVFAYTPTETEMPANQFDTQTRVTYAEYLADRFAKRAGLEAAPAAKLASLCMLAALHAENASARLWLGRALAHARRSLAERRP